jgi:hypothetical protein
VNDTHVHKPLKSHHRTLAHEWFMRNMVRLRLRHRLFLRAQASTDPAVPPVPNLSVLPDSEQAGPSVAPALAAPTVDASNSAAPGPRPLNTEDYHAQVHALMSMTRLRNMAPQWLLDACNTLMRPIEGEGRNIFRKGWEQLYLEPIREPGAGST